MQSNFEFSEHNVDLEAELRGKLRDSLKHVNRQSINKSFTFSRSREGQLIAGVTGSLSYDWLHVEMFWVHEPHRRTGVGRNLMEHVLDYARSLGAKKCWLETSSEDALKFYQSLGFEVFGVLSNDAEQFPPEVTRYFLKRNV